MDHQARTLRGTANRVATNSPIRRAGTALLLTPVSRGDGAAAKESKETPEPGREAKPAAEGAVDARLEPASGEARVRTGSIVDDADAEGVSFTEREIDVNLVHEGDLLKVSLGDAVRIACTKRAWGLALTSRGS